MAIEQADRAVAAPGALAAPTVCIGHSHATAAAQAARADGREIDAILFWSEAGALGPDGLLRPDLAERVRGAGAVVAAIGGASAVVVGLVEHHRPFDFVLPTEPDLPLDPQRELVPAAGVRAALEAAEAPYTPLLAQLRALNAGPIVQLGPPPPVYDNALIEASVPWGLWPDQPRSIAPPLVRYKLWRLSSEVIAAACARLGVIFQPAPKASLDAAGFLRPALSADGLHGDAAYGRLIWDELDP